MRSENILQVLTTSDNPNTVTYTTSTTKQECTTTVSHPSKPQPHHKESEAKQMLCQKCSLYCQILLVKGCLILCILVAAAAPCSAKTIAMPPAPKVNNVRHGLQPKADRTAAAAPVEATINGLGSAASKLSKSVLSKVFSSKNAEKALEGIDRATDFYESIKEFIEKFNQKAGAIYIYRSSYQ